MDLPEFLLARIAEDEERAREAGGAYAWQSDGGPEGRQSGISSLDGDALVVLDMEAMVRLDRSTLALFTHLTEWLPARVLAECEAKRQVLGILAEIERVTGAGRYSHANDAVRLMALPYADHEDYRDEWRP